MKRFTILFLILIVMAILVSSSMAHAGPIDWIKGVGGSLGMEALAVIVTAAFGMIGGGGYIFIRVFKTFKEIGEFLTAVGTAFEDGKASPEELGAMFREGKDVLNVWRDSKYKPT